MCQKIAWTENITVSAVQSFGQVIRTEQDVMSLHDALYVEAGSMKRLPHHIAFLGRDVNTQYDYFSGPEEVTSLSRQLAIAAEAFSINFASFQQSRWSTELRLKVTNMHLLVADDTLARIQKRSFLSKVLFSWRLSFLPFLCGYDDGGVGRSIRNYVSDGHQHAELLTDMLNQTKTISNQRRELESLMKAIHLAFAREVEAWDSECNGSQEEATTGKIGLLNRLCGIRATVFGPSRKCVRLSPESKVLRADALIDTIQELLGTMATRGTPDSPDVRSHCERLKGLPVEVLQPEAAQYGFQGMLNRISSRAAFRKIVPFLHDVVNN